MNNDILKKADEAIEETDKVLEEVNSETAETTVKSEEREDKHRIHIVQPGEDLWDIAHNELGNGHRFDIIMKLNGMKTRAVHEGQILKLPYKI